MNTSTSCRYHEFAIHIPLRKLFIALALAPLFWVSTAALAVDGRLSFHGRITQATCVFVPPAAVMSRGHERASGVAARMDMMVSHSRSVCGKQGVPFTAKFHSMSPTAMAMTGSGILTLTYQ